jgi:energy-coupling factor transporter ATP-binding protein EcfA2
MISERCYIQAEGVYFGYVSGAAGVLDNISICVPEGKLTVLTGMSGCGKSTLAHILCGVIPHGIKGDLKGKVSIGGKDVSELSLPQAAKSVGMVFQQVDNQLFMPTVEEEVVFALENFCCPPEIMSSELDKVLLLLGIEHLRHRNPSSLSEGEKRLVAIAGVLILGPGCIILDEPFAGLDESNCRLIQDILSKLKAQGKAILVIEHDIERLKAADIVYIMYNGKIAKRLEGEELHGFLQNGISDILLPKASGAV